MLNEQAVKSIEELHRLKSQGVITEEEFAQAKMRILSGKSETRSQTGEFKVPSSDWSYPAQEDFQGWIMLPLKRYADFNGRSTRKEFWLFQLVPAAIIVAMVLAFAMDASADSEPGGLAMLTLVAGIIALLGLIIPQLALQVRRFHDQDMSGLFVLLNLIPYVGGLIVLVLMCIEGTRGDNRFGPNPKDQMS